jgi:hypothetical protein
MRMSGYTSFYDIATSYTADEVYELLRHNLDFVTEAIRREGFTPKLKTTNEGVLIEVYPDMWPGAVEEVFGFRPTVRVSLELARGGDPGFDEGGLNTTRTVNWLINNIKGDAVFLPNGDLPVLLRRGDQVWLDKKEEWWGEEDLKLLTFPYEWKELPEY